MKNEFIEKIIRERIVDTAKYRYVIKECGDHAEIQRLPIKQLDTTDAIDGWSVVKVIR